MVQVLQAVQCLAFERKGMLEPPQFFHSLPSLNRLPDFDEFFTASRKLVSSCGN